MPGGSTLQLGFGGGPVVVGLIWGWMFERQNGLVNAALGAVGIPAIPWLVDGGWALFARVNDDGKVELVNHLGISLGDDCIVEAGLYVTAGSKIVLANEAPLHDGTRPVVKGAQLSGQNGILFRRNSLSGAIEAVRREGKGITLNEALHA